MSRAVNQRTLDLIKGFEGLRLNAYKDSVGVLTIGYGHTGSDVKIGQRIDKPQAEELLRLDLERFTKGVEQLVKVQLSDNEFGAVVSFAFNCGLGNLQSSTLLRLLNAGFKKQASEQFQRWNKAGGKVLNGLTLRREAERELFLSEK